MLAFHAWLELSCNGINALESEFRISRAPAAPAAPPTPATAVLLIGYAEDAGWLFAARRRRARQIPNSAPRIPITATAPAIPAMSSTLWLEAPLVVDELPLAVPDAEESWTLGGRELAVPVG